MSLHEAIGTTPLASPRRGAYGSILTELLKNSTKRIYVVKLTTYDPVGGSETTLYFSGGYKSFISTSTDTPASTYFTPSITSPVYEYSINVFESSGLSPSAQGALGELTIINNDGSFDNYLDYHFGGRTCEILVGYDGLSLSEFLTIWKGTVELVTWDLQKVSIRVRDNKVKFDVPIQENIYSGLGGFGGGENIKGQYRPLGWGQIRNVTPILINTSYLLYQLHDGVIYDVNSVRDQGVELIDSGDKYFWVTNCMFQDWTAGAPDNWTLAGAAATVETTTDKQSVSYAAKITRNGTNATLTQRLTTTWALSNFRTYDLTLTAEVKADAANQIRIALIDDNGTSYSGYNTTTDENEALTVTRTIAPNTNTFTKTLDHDNDFGTAVNEMNFRSVYAAAALSNSGAYVRVKFKSNTSYALRIRGASIGERSGATSSFTSSPTRLTFGGSNQIDVTANSTQWSDWVAFSLDETKSYLINVYVFNTLGQTVVYSKESSTAGEINYRNTNQGDDTMNSAMTGSVNTDVRIIHVTEIEIQPSVTYVDVQTVVEVDGSSIIDNVFLEANGKISAWTQTSGEYGLFKNQGIIQLGASPNGTVTTDFQGDASGTGYVSSTKDIVRRIAGGSRWGKLTDPTDFDLGSFTKITNTAVANYWTGTNSVNISGILDELMNTLGGWWTFNRRGQITIGILEEPYGYKNTLEENEIISITRLALADPLWRLRFGYEKMYTVQSPDDLAGAVTDENKILYGNEFRYIKNEDITIRDEEFLLSDELTVDSLFDETTDAETEGSRRFDLYKIKRDLYQIDTNQPPLTHQLGDKILITHSRLGLSSGKRFVVVGINEDGERNNTQLVVWGPGI